MKLLTGEEEAGLPATKVFNDEYFGPTKDSHTSGFHGFSRLPPELRRHVWKLSAQRRFIRLRISLYKDGAPSVRPPSYSSHNHLGNIISGDHYELWADAAVNSTANPLFSTTAESRRAALELYRIRFPLAGGRILRMYPEYDVLYLVGWHRALCLVADTLFGKPQAADLLFEEDNVGEEYDFVDIFDDVFDNQAAGGTLGIVPPGRDTALQHPVAVASFVDILCTKLRSLWCVEPLQRNSRACYPSSPEPAGRLAHVAETCPLRPRFRKLDRGATGFDWLERDPRPAVEPDLRQLTFRNDPRRFLHTWRNLEASLGVRRPAGSPFRF